MSQETREQLLHAACQIFAKQGFDKAKVADICQLAGANVAAVNYHFGSKDKLYVKATVHAFECASEEFPLRGDLPEDAAPTRKLQAFLEALVSRLMSKGPAGNFHRIVTRELALGHSALDDIINKTLRHDRALLLEILAEMAGRSFSSKQQHLLTHMVISPVMTLGLHRIRSEGNPAIPDNPESVRAFAQLLYNYTLAGLTSLFALLPADSPDRNLPDLVYQQIMDDANQKDASNDKN